MLIIRNAGNYSCVVPVESKVFAGGEVHPLIDPVIATWSGIQLTAHLKNSQDVMELLLVVDAIRRLNPDMVIHLYMPYMPYARQDRVANAGEALGVKVFAKLINDLRCDTVRVLDCHSDTGVALLDNCISVGLSTLIRKAYPNQDWMRTVLVAPDAGASKKVEALAIALGCPSVVQAFKHRDTLTGQITGTTINKFSHTLLDHDFLVVDDICDGGRTFIELGKVLKHGHPTDSEDQITGKVRLWVTHGIFSHGYEELRAIYHGIRCTNSFHPQASMNTRPDGEFDAAYYFHSVEGFV